MATDKHFAIDEDFSVGLNHEDFGDGPTIAVLLNLVEPHSAGELGSQVVPGGLPPGLTHFGGVNAAEPDFFLLVTVADPEGVAVVDGAFDDGPLSWGGFYDLLRDGGGNGAPSNGINTAHGTMANPTHDATNCDEDESF